MSHWIVQNMQRLSRASAAGVAAFVIVAASPALAQDSDVKPSPIEFRTSYGEMQFPEKYPDGTSISITQWSHFVPRYDEWFAKYTEDWGKAHNVKVTVNHINLSDLPASLAASIAAGEGPTLVEMNAAPSAFIEGLQPLDDVNAAAEATFGDIAQTCRYSSYLPSKKMWYGFCHGWVPDPGVYRTDLWQKAGYKEGPVSYDDLLEGGGKIFKETGNPVAVGLSPELDSEFYTRALIWSFGGSVQDKDGNVVLDSPETVAAAKYQKKLFDTAMTPQVFAWNPASNNQTYIAGQASYIQNSISFFRSAQDIGSSMADITGFRPGLQGPSGKAYMPSHVWFIYVMPAYVKDKMKVTAAKNFILDLNTNYSSASYYSKLYNFPAFDKQVPQLYQDGGWLDKDPWGSKPADKLAILKSAADWTVWLGYPGYANPAVGEVYQTHILTTMMANVARGTATPEQAVKDADAQIKTIFAKWRERGFVGGEK
jgi:multiple sugar transport system substrate-binding protein